MRPRLVRQCGAGHAHRRGAQKQLRLWWNQRFPGLQARLNGATCGARHAPGSGGQFSCVAIALALAGADCVPGTFRCSKHRVCLVGSGCKRTLGVGATCHGCCGGTRRGAMDAVTPRCVALGWGAVVLGNGISDRTLYGTTGIGLPEGYGCALAV